MSDAKDLKYMVNLTTYRRNTAPEQPPYSIDHYQQHLDCTLDMVMAMTLIPTPTILNQHQRVKVEVYAQKRLRLCVEFFP
jgi:hypothetical protein